MIKGKDFSWIWGLLAIVVALWMCGVFDGGGGTGSQPSYPLDPQAEENWDLQQEMNEGKLEADYDYDPGAERWDAEADEREMEEALMELEAQHFDDVLKTESAYENEVNRSNTEYANTITNCPSGCTQYQPGCDIKGNIGYESGEKIYHVPGGEFYSDTTISPDYGERWFCTEADAIANGWRKSYQ